MNGAALALLGVWTVAAFGAAYIAGHSVATRALREWIAGRQVAQCPTCGATAEGRFADGFMCDGEGGPAKHAAVAFALAPPAPWRFWAVTLLECPACLGFWLGVLGGLAAPPVPGISGWGVVLGLGAYTAGALFLLGRATGLMRLEE